MPMAKVSLPAGEMAEWLKAHAWKACILQKGIEGSNPSLSAKIFRGKILARSRLSKLQSNFDKADPPGMA